MFSLPASIKRIRSKTIEKRWRHNFPHYKSMGAFCCHGNQSFDPICPKILCSLSPTPVKRHIKFDQDWPKVIQVQKSEIFVTQGQVTPKWVVWVQCANLPKNLMQPFPHPIDATHKIWSRLANWLQRYSSSKRWNFRHSQASNSKMSGLILPKNELDWAFMPVLVTSNFDDDLIKNKNEQASMETIFSHYKSTGIFLDHQGS